MKTNSELLQPREHNCWGCSPLQHSPFLGACRRVPASRARELGAPELLHQVISCNPLRSDYRPAEQQVLVTGAPTLESA